MAKVVKKCIVPGVLQVDSGRTKRRFDPKQLGRLTDAFHACYGAGKNE
jgi:hypothetical protein